MIKFKVLLAVSLMLFSGALGCGRTSAVKGPKGDKGDVGVVGAQGPSGAQGASGSDGQQGTQGPPGVDGQNGTNATPVTPIQFCPGVTPTYPSVFAEYGICLGGQLYGVYSTNGGFLALLPPGTYNSNAVGSNCNFVVLPNCQIQN